MSGIHQGQDLQAICQKPLWHPGCLPQSWKECKQYWPHSWSGLDLPQRLHVGTTPHDLSDLRRWPDDGPTRRSTLTQRHQIHPSRHSFSIWGGCRPPRQLQSQLGMYASDPATTMVLCRTSFHRHSSLPWLQRHDFHRLQAHPAPFCSGEEAPPIGNVTDCLDSRRPGHTGPRK